VTTPLSASHSTGGAALQDEPGDWTKYPLPVTARDLFSLPLRQRLAYGAVVGLAERTGVWRHSMRAYGDLERMRFIDKAYWLYKTTSPVRKARPGSGLEDYFRRQDATCVLPAGFRVEGSLRMSSAGDLMHHPFLSRSEGILYRDVADVVFGADLAMANLECPIVARGREFIFRFDTPPPLSYRRRDFDVAAGHDGRKFDFVATACNHSLDFGVAGADETMRELQTAGIAFNGLNADEHEAFHATILERSGFRIGVLAYTFGLNAYRPPEDRAHIVNTMLLNDGVAANSFTQLQRQLEHCRAEGADLIVAHLHWGFEHEFYPSPEQVELAHHLAELGVGLIVGHHPHVIQPVEYYRTVHDPDRVVPIYYSLGNLVNPFSAAYLCRSGVADIAIARGIRADGKLATYVSRAGLVELDQLVDLGTGRLRLAVARRVKSESG
jgi:poly-gamma-glutamate synthesis protein (capsule biosynthesis protein)